MIRADRQVALHTKVGSSGFVLDSCWEAYVGLPKGATAAPDSPHYVGALALFGHGIHDEPPHGGFQPAAFSFQIDRAVQTALSRDSSISVDLSFVARGAVVKGEPASARNEATLTIGKARLATRSVF